MSRVLALLIALLLAAFPVRAALLDPGVPWLVKVAWLLLLGIGFARPAWRGPIVIGLVPLLPWMPLELKGVPHGVVHLAVASQALPWLVRPGPRAQDLNDAVTWSWWLLVGVAAVSLAVQYGAYATLFATPLPFIRELAAHLTTYAFGRPGPSFENMMAATAVFGTGALTFALVRSAPQPRHTLVQILGAVGLVVSIIGVWQAATGAGLRQEWRINDPFITRINATFGDPNALGAFLATLLPVILALAARQYGRTRLLWMATAGVVGIALVMTAGRIAALAGLAGVAVLTGLAIVVGLDRVDPSALVRRHLRRSVLALAALTILGLIALVGAGTALDARHAQQRSYLDTWLYTFNLRRPLDETAKGRLAIWGAAVRMIEDRPAFGIGIGRIYRLFGYYADDSSQLPDRMTFSAHSTYLNVGAELGLVGLLTWLLLLGTAWRAGWRRLRSRPPEDDPASRWLDAGLLGGLTAALVAMTTGDRSILYEDLVLLGAVTGLLAAGGTPAAAAGPVTRRHLGYGGVALALLLCTFPPRLFAERRGVRLDHVTSGLNPIERQRDGSTFRWSEGKAMFYLPPDASTLHLRLRSLAPMPQTVQVMIRGTLVFSTTLNDHNWVEIRPVLPRTRPPEYQRVDLAVDPTWTPRTDHRHLGVMVDWSWR